MATRTTKNRPPEHVEEPRPQPLDARLIDGANEEALTKHLLAISLQRLDAALQLERTRGIVYPESTCILRDCERLSRKLRDLKTGRITRAALDGRQGPPGGLHTHDVAPGRDFLAEEGIDPSDLI